MLLFFQLDFSSAHDKTGHLGAQDLSFGQCGAKACLGLLSILLLIKLALLLGGGVLVLLVLRHQVVHVGLCLRELHLIHALACVPVKESLHTKSQNTCLNKR